MKEFYIVGRWGTDHRGEPYLYTYSYNGSCVSVNRESAEMTAEHCNERWPAEGDRGEWRLFKIVDVEE